MKIDRYFNPNENVFTVSSSIIKKLQSDTPQSINSFLSEMLLLYPNTYENYLFESLGFLFLVGKIYVNEETDEIGLME